jgi:hypothetical protein
MTKIEPSEAILTGKWITQDGKMIEDTTCKRIHDLTTSYLHKITHDASGWETLYRDPADGRFWEKTYPQSHMHGGGPLQLQCLTIEEARKKYPQIGVLSRNPL